MSALQFLREKAGVLVAGVIGLSLFLFVVSDFFGGGRGQRMKQKKYYEIGQIGGEYVSYQDYDLRLQNLSEIYKLSGRTNIDESTTETMREQTWQQIVREKILDSQYKKLGIGVSTEEVDELVLGNNPHQIVQQLFTDQKTGVFNKSSMVNFLKQTEVDETAKKYWLFFENIILLLPRDCLLPLSRLSLTKILPEILLISVISLKITLLFLIHRSASPKVILSLIIQNISRVIKELQSEILST
jgi:peptidyl-prolyl cis-trans isomerase D